jgi:hypothetical protein
MGRVAGPGQPAAFSLRASSGGCTADQCNHPVQWGLDWVYGAMLAIDGSIIPWTDGYSLASRQTKGLNYVSYNVQPNNVTLPYLNPIINIVQTLYSAVCIDFGIIYPSNPILYPSVVPETITDVFPTATSSSLFTPTTYGIFARGVWEGEIPLSATINAEYQCRFSFRKSPGQAFIDVLVATLSIFTSAWGAIMLVAVWFAQREEKGMYVTWSLMSCLMEDHISDNFCEGHPDATRGEKDNTLPYKDES